MAPFEDLYPPSAIPSRTTLPLHAFQTPTPDIVRYKRYYDLRTPSPGLVRLRKRKKDDDEDTTGVMADLTAALLCPAATTDKHGKTQTPSCSPRSERYDNFKEEHPAAYKGMQVIYTCFGLGPDVELQDCGQCHRWRRRSRADCMGILVLLPHQETSSARCAWHRHVF